MSINVKHRGSPSSTDTLFDGDEERIKVFIRIRNDLDETTKMTPPYTMHSSVEVVSDSELKYKDKIYNFAGVYSPGCSHEDIYADMRDRYVDPAMNGVQVRCSSASNHHHCSRRITHMGSFRIRTIFRLLFSTIPALSLLFLKGLARF